MLETIQKMKFYLRTAYGDSKTFASLTIKIKMQGLEQVNRASPAGWCIISIAILQAHGVKGHGAHFLARLSQVWQSLLAILYVNDTNLLHLNMNTDESVHKVRAALQRAIKNWDRLQIATRGSPKPEKCFFHLLDFAWTAKGGWQYIAHHDKKSAMFTAPMPNGTMAPITHLAVDNAQKTLGVVRCPSGNSGGILHHMKEKVQNWLDSLTAGRLHCQMVWFSIDRQL
jgi:hypothetical protein